MSAVPAAQAGDRSAQRVDLSVPGQAVRNMRSTDARRQSRAVSMRNTQHRFEVVRGISSTSTISPRASALALESRHDETGI